MNKDFRRFGQIPLIAHSILLVCILSVPVSACNKLDTQSQGTQTTVGTKLDDSMITAKVKAELLKDNDIKSLNISVTTINGHVTLRGAVDNQSQINLSIEHAKSVDGVISVNNQLMIKDHIDKGD